MKSLEPRDAFFGGRTGAVALHAVAGCGKTFVEGFWLGGSGTVMAYHGVLDKRSSRNIG